MLLAMTDDPNDGDSPSVDELEARLTKIELAMNQLQASELNPAESTIDSVAQQIDGIPTS